MPPVLCGLFHILTFYYRLRRYHVEGANPAYKDVVVAGALIGGAQHGGGDAAARVAQTCSWPSLFLAVAFATILAVVAGLNAAHRRCRMICTLTFRKGATEREELKVPKITVLRWA